MRIFIILALLLIISPVKVIAQPIEQDESDWRRQIETEIKEQADTLDVGEWREFLSGTGEVENAILPQGNISDIVADLALGRLEINAGEILRQGVFMFYGGILHNLRWMAKIMALGIICGIINNLKESFKNESVAEIVFFACYATIILLVMHSFIPVLDSSKMAIQRMVQFMQMLFPVLLAFLVAVGGVVSSALMQPAIAFMAGLVGLFLRNVMIPLILLSAVIVLVNNISDKMKLHSMSALVSSICVWILSGIFTVFIGVLVVQGVIAATFDGLSARTAKFAIDTFVPIVGGIFSQALDVIVGCSLMVKNAVGVVGLLILASISLYPALNVLSLVAVYKISAALLEPVTEERVVSCLNGLGNVMTILFVSVMGVAIMFFISITLIIATGNMAVMLR